MKPEEAIKILKERIELTKKVWSNVPEIIEYREALELAVKALQIQIPMKPDNIEPILGFSGKYYTSKGNCPVCTRKGLYKSDFWCNKCGQKLDWSEEGEINEVEKGNTD